MRNPWTVALEAIFVLSILVYLFDDSGIKAVVICGFVTVLANLNDIRKDVVE